MIFKKFSKKPTKQYLFPGKPDVLDGRTAIRVIESQMAELIGKVLPDGAARGLAACGCRSAEIIDGSNPLEISRLINSQSAYRNLPLVVHLGCGNPEGSAEYGGYESYHLAGEQGFFQMFAANVQEVLDYTLIARRIAELSLSPGICAHDFLYTGQSLQSVRMIEKKLSQKFLGAPGDIIECPTPAQKILYGEKRRRIPQLLDIDRPAGIGGTHGGESQLNTVAARHPFFYGHLTEITDRAMTEFGELTGRFYSRLSTYKIKDADYVIISQGPISKELCQEADLWRQAKKVKLGVVNIAMFCPFPDKEISHLLKGKKGVTVLEHVDFPQTGELPMLANIRAGIDKAMENGTIGKGALPYPDYAIYTKLNDRPPLFSGVYGIGASYPSPEDLEAIMENMLPDAPKKRQFYVGVHFHQAKLRFPKLAIIQQKLDKEYPELESLSVFGGPRKLDKTANALESGSVQIYTFAGHSLGETGSTLATVLAGAGFPHINTFPGQNISGGQQSIVYTIQYSREPLALQNNARIVDALAAADLSLLPNLDCLKDKGALIIQSSLTAQSIWENLSEKQRQQITRLHVKLYSINAGEIAGEIAAIPGYVEHLMLQALTGAYLKAEIRFDAKNRNKILNHFRRLMENKWGNGYFLIEEILTALKKGISQVQEIDWEKFPPLTSLTPPEPEAPWTVQQVKAVDESPFDLVRFWDSVGYFYENDRVDQTLTDPFLALGVIPARSSAFRDMTAARTHVPLLLEENCSGCGLCWTRCPDSALPAVIQEISVLVKSALNRCRDAGQNLIQITRIVDQLSKQAYNIIARDDLRQYLKMGDLLQEAFNRLVERMNLQEEQLNTLTEEFRNIHKMLAKFPIVRTKTFFSDPHRKQKGCGLILSITVNPNNCKGCMSCTAVCPDNALVKVEQTGDIIEEYRQNWQFLMGLPQTSEERLQEHICQEKPQSLVNHLLNQKVYHSLLGGDNGLKGSGIKTAVHLLTASIEALMQPRVKSFLENINQLIKQIETKIQTRFQNAVNINEFEEFSKRLSHLESDDLSAAALSNLVFDKDSPEQKIDGRQLKRLNNLLIKLKELHQIYLEGANGDGRARLAMILGQSKIFGWSSRYPYNPFPNPWVIHQGDNDITTLAQGVFEGIMRTMAETFTVIRQAKLELEDDYNPAEHKSFFQQFCWRQFTEEERALCPPVLILGDPSIMTGQTFAGISRLLNANIPIKIAVINTLDDDYNEPGGSSTYSGSSQTPEPITNWEIGLWAVSQNKGFVLQTSAANPSHFISGVMEGMSTSGSALFHIYACDPHLHGLPVDQADAQEKLAINSRAFPLFKFDPSLSENFRERFLLDGNPAQEEDWATLEHTVNNGGSHETLWMLPLTFADWAVNEGRFKNHFRPIAKSGWHEEMIPLSDYLNLKPEDRLTKEPFIYLFGKENKAVRIVVSPAMAQLTDSRRQLWRMLQEIAGFRSPQKEAWQQMREIEFQKELNAQKQSIESDLSKKFAQMDQGSRAIYHQRLTKKLLALCGIEAKNPMFNKPLSDFQSGEE